MNTSNPSVAMRRQAPRNRMHAGRLIAALWVALVACALPQAHAAVAGPCADAAHCRLDGPLMAQAVKVNVTHSGGYQGVRTTVRFTNVGSTPLILGYRNKSARLSDDKGLAYKWSFKLAGIGRVDSNEADPQFQLAPGEAREASFQHVVQYDARHTVVGSIFDQSFTLVQLTVQPNGQVHSSREYELGFSGLTATSGFGADAAQAAAPTMATAAATGTAGGVTDPCAGQPGCQAQGPLVVHVVGVNVTEGTTPTRTRTVHTTLRIQNVSGEPIILGYRVGSASLTDNQGLAYGRGHSNISEARYVHGIGQVSRDGADTQFQLAPGQSRDASFDSLLQYDVRHTTAGNVFSFDVTLAQLAVVGDRQVRTQHEYAMSFSNISASAGLNAGVAGVAGIADGAKGAAQVVQAVGQIVNLFKGLGK